MDEKKRKGYETIETKKKKGSWRILWNFNQSSPLCREGAQNTKAFHSDTPERPLFPKHGPCLSVPERRYPVAPSEAERTEPVPRGLGGPPGGICGGSGRPAAAGPGVLCGAATAPGHPAKGILRDWPFWCPRHPWVLALGPSHVRARAQPLWQHRQTARYATGDGMREADDLVVLPVPPHVLPSLLSVAPPAISVAPCGPSAIPFHWPLSQPPPDQQSGFCWIIPGPCRRFSDQHLTNI